MNINDISEINVEDGAETEDITVSNFVSNFKRKAKTHSSLFENSFTQKIVTTSQTNYKDYQSSKFQEYKLGSDEFLTDMTSITAHTKCKIVRDNNGTHVPLESGESVATIAGGVINALIKNFRLFLYSTQLNSERPDRYTILAYLSRFFDADMTDVTDFDYLTGFYIDQSDPNYLLTSKATNCSKEIYESEACSKGHYQSATMFSNSATHTFCQTLDSSFLYSHPNLLLPTVIHRYTSDRQTD